MLTVLEKVDLLRNAPLFGEIATESLARVAAIAQEVSWEGRHVVFLEDAPAETMFLLLEGEVEMARNGRSERSVRPPEAIGALDLLADRPHAESATTLQPTRALQIDQQDLYEAMREDFNLTRGILRSLVSFVIGGA